MKNMTSITLDDDK